MQKKIKPISLLSSKKSMLDEIIILRSKIETIYQPKHKLTLTTSGTINLGGYWEWDDVKKKPSYLSEEMAIILGLTQEALYELYQTEADFLPLVHPEDLALYCENLNIIRNYPTDLAHTFDYRIIRPSGEIRHVRELEYAVLVEKGIRVKIFGAIRDVTNYKESQILLRDSDERYSALFENLPLGVMIEDYSEVKKVIDQLLFEGIEDLKSYLLNKPELTLELVKKIRLIDANPALLNLCGYDSLQQLADANASPFWWNDDWLNFYANEITCFTGFNKRHDTEMSYKRIDGSVFEAKIISAVIEGDEDDWKQVLSIYEDITLRHQMEVTLLDNQIMLENLVKDRTGKLIESEQHFQILVETAPMCIHQINLDGTMMSMNKAGLAMINAEDEASVIGSSFMEMISDQDSERIMTLMQDAYQGQCSEFEFSNKNGMEFISNFVPIYDFDQKVTRLMGITQDVTEKNKAQQTLSYQASYDALTGLINRSEFERQVERLISTSVKTKSVHALCFMDLDQFKVVNDTCGHMAGDELLRQIGKQLLSSVRKSDTFARLGGDEFGLLLEHCSFDQAERMANTLLDEVKAFRFYWEGKEFRIGASIGLCEITESTVNFTELFRQADAACYMAKDLGRNRVHLYRYEDSELLRRHGEMQWIPRITEALEKNLFTLYAQCIEPLDEETGSHCEVLVRMMDVGDSIIPPGAFLPAAERYGLIRDIDSWVVETTLTLMASHPEFLKQVHLVSINLSGSSIDNVDFLDSVISSLKKFSIDANKICFEITETAAISNLNAARIFISKLKNLGCFFALDDFGSGLSSFRYLKNLPVDYLKIDGMFVKGMGDDPIDYAMVKSINEIGHVMGMKTIAEFVETTEIKNKLTTLGVDYAQGYCIGEPEPFTQLLNHYSGC